MLLPLRLQAAATGSNLALQVMKNDDQKYFKIESKNVSYLLRFLEVDSQIKSFSLKKKSEKDHHPIVQRTALK